MKTDTASATPDPLPQLIRCEGTKHGDALMVVFWCPVCDAASGTTLHCGESGYAPTRRYHCRCNKCDDVRFDVVISVTIVPTED